MKSQYQTPPPAERFDLSPAASEADRNSRFLRQLSVAETLVMMGVGVFGLLLLAVGRKETLHDWIAPLIVAGGGFAVAGVVWRFSPRSGPRTLRVTANGISLEDIPNSRPVQIRWDQPRFEIYLFDFRSQPKVNTDGTPRTIDFVLQVRRAPYAQIPEAAYQDILEQARARGLEITRRVTGIRGSPTPILEITIRAPG